MGLYCIAKKPFIVNKCLFVLSWRTSDIFDIRTCLLPLLEFKSHSSELPIVSGFEGNNYPANCLSHCSVLNEDGDEVCNQGGDLWLLQHCNSHLGHHLLAFRE